MLYKKGAGVMGEMLHVMEAWMEENHYTQISDFRGLMNAGKTGGGAAFERTQFFKQFGKYE